MEHNGSDEEMNRIIELWLEEFAVNSEVFCPVESTKESLISPFYSTDNNRNRYLIVLTDPDSDSYPYIVKVPYDEVFKVVMNDKNCAGIFVDPMEDGTFVPKHLMITVNEKQSNLYERV